MFYSVKSLQLFCLWRRDVEQVSHIARADVVLPLGKFLSSKELIKGLSNQLRRLENDPERSRPSVPKDLSSLHIPHLPVFLELAPLHGETPP